MSYLIRKISRSKWKDCDADLTTPLSADAITNCLKTSGNTLSVWYAEDDKAIINAKIALLGALQQLDTIDIVVLNLDDVLKNDLVLEETLGQTDAKRFSGLHRDIAKLSVDKLKDVATLIREKIVEGSKCERITRQQFKAILNDAISNKLILKSDLKEGLSKSL